MDAFNDHNDDDDSCYFRYWKDGSPIVNCETGEGAYPLGAFDSNGCAVTTTCCDCSPSGGGACCTGSTSACASQVANAAGLGTELDWIRQFWAVHVGAEADTDVVGYSHIVDWLKEADDWVDEDAFTKLNAQALDGGYLSDLPANWSAFCDDNAVDQ